MNISYIGLNTHNGGSLTTEVRDVLVMVIILHRTDAICTHTPHNFPVIANAGDLDSHGVVNMALCPLWVNKFFVGFNEVPMLN